MSEMEPGNQQQVVNNYDTLARNNIGAIDKAMQDISQGKVPSANGGGDGFSMVTEVIVAKSGPAGFVADVNSEIGGGGVENSAFFGGGGHKRRNKKEVALDNKMQMVLSNRNAVTGKLDRQQNLALWKEVRKEIAKKFPTKGDVMANSARLAEIGCGQIKKNLENIHVARNNRSLYEDVQGSDMGLQDAKESLKTQPKEEVLRVAKTMTEEKRDALASDVLSSDHLYWFKKLESRKADEDWRENEKKELQAPPAEKQENAYGVAPGAAQAQKAMAALPDAAAEVMGPKAGPLAPPAPTWATKPPGAASDKDEKERWS